MERRTVPYFHDILLYILQFGQHHGQVLQLLREHGQIWMIWYERTGRFEHAIATR